MRRLSVVEVSLPQVTKLVGFASDNERGREFSILILIRRSFRNVEYWLPFYQHNLILGTKLEVELLLKTICPVQGKLHSLASSYFF